MFFNASYVVFQFFFALLCSVIGAGCVAVLKLLVILAGLVFIIIIQISGARQARHSFSRLSITEERRSREISTAISYRRDDALANF